MIRFFDFLLSLFFLFVFFPIFITFIILNYILNKKIFFVSERVGYKGNKFRLIKFITMKNEIFLKLGKFFRRTSLDELPQLLNILKGDMSLVGPRPYPIENFKNMNKKIFYLRHSVKPGLTGLTQIQYRGKKRTIEEKISIDLRMIKTFNLLFYFKILIYTPKAVLVRFIKNKSGASL